jgi:hypothetical protein
MESILYVSAEDFIKILSVYIAFFCREHIVDQIFRKGRMEWR